MAKDDDLLIDPGGAEPDEDERPGGIPIIGGKGGGPVRPKLRSDLQLATTRDEQGGQLLMIQDPLGLLPQPVAMRGLEALVVSLLDGRRDLRDIQAELMRQTGEMIELELIENLVAQLDRVHLLESERYLALKAAMEAEERKYRESPVRPMTSAGQAYLVDAARLAIQLERRLETVGVPESPPALCGIASPHIDYQRAGLGYAHAYAALKNGPRPDRVLILGVAHQGCGRQYAAMTKALATPFGELPCDADLLRQVDERLPFDLFEGEMAHLGEHSIELQAPWLRHLLGEVPVLPVLCHGLHDVIISGEDPSTAEPDVRAFVEAMGKALEQAGGRTLIVAAVDLSHVGPMFGDERRVEPDWLEDVEQSDRELLEVAARRDATAFFESFAATRDRTHICGHAALYTMLALIGDGPPGELRAYRQWADAQGLGAVSFAAMNFAE